MHKRARKHKTITEYEIESRMKDREFSRVNSNGIGVCNARRLKRWLRYCLQQWAIYNRRPWEDVIH